MSESRGQKITSTCKIGIITGLKSEEKIVKRRNGVVSMCIGVGNERSYQAAKILVEKYKVSKLVSFGLAGALDPELKVGDVVTSYKIITSFRTSEVNMGIHDKTTCKSFYTLDCHISAKVPPRNDEAANIISLNQPILSSQEKQRLFNETGAIAIDMESGGIKKAAEEAGIPFVAIKAISDTANQNIPKEVLNGINPNGSANYKAILKEIIKNPVLIFDLIKLGVNSWRAHRSLKQQITHNFNYT